jgi:hypothetical protein
LLLALAGCDGVFGLESVHAPVDAPPDVMLDGAPASVIGCADGTREAFTDIMTYPYIAGCDGAWSTAGVINPPVAGAACATSGNSGGDGNGCTIANLCAPGWSVCANQTAVQERTTGDGCNVVTFPLDSFYATKISGDGGRICNGLGTNDVFGCGTAGQGADSSCYPISKWSGDLCSLLTASGGGWACGNDQFSEAINVTKSDPTSGGGALCCKG